MAEKSSPVRHPARVAGKPVPKTGPGSNLKATVSPKTASEKADDDDDDDDDEVKEVRKPIRPATFTITTPQTRERFLKLLVYGAYGVGKTRLAGTSVDVKEMNDILLIDAESGDMTLDDEAFNFQDIDSIQITDYKQLARVAEYLKIHCILRDDPSKEATEKLIKKESELKGVKITKPKRYRTVIIDSLTEVEVYCMNQLLGITDSTKLDEEVATAEWAEYKRNHSMIQRMVRSFRDLPMHVIMTCAAQYVQDEQKKQLWTPAMTGKLSSQVQGFMDMVGYLVIGGLQDDGSIPRRLYVQPAGRYAAKCRFSSFKGSYFDDPTIGSILDEIGLTPGKVQ